MKKAVSLILTLCILLSSLATGMFAVSASALGKETITVSVEYDQSGARGLFSTINQYRKTNERPTLEYDYSLEETAMRRAAEIAVSYSHTSPDGATENKDENIAYGTPTAADVMQVWINTDTGYQDDLDNLLNSNYASAGVSHVKFMDEDYWVLVLKTYVKDTTATSAAYGKQDVTMTVDASGATISSVELAEGEAELRVEDEQDLPQATATMKLPHSVHPFDAVVTPTWTSSNTSVCGVEENKAVKAFEAGSAVLTAEFGRESAIYRVSVRERSTGFTYWNGAWYVMEDGTVQRNLNTILKGTVDGVEAWWLVRNGKVTYDTTVAQNANGWWYVKDGKVDFTYSGYAENENGIWTIKNGKVDFSINDIIKTTYDGEEAWWLIRKGRLCTDTTTVAQNKNGWWYVEDGKVDFTYSGVATNENGSWLIEKGRVKFGVYDILRSQRKLEDGTMEGGWYYFQNGKLQDAQETIAQNKYGWWYVEDGKVDFDYTGIATNQYGTWYVQDGETWTSPFWGDCRTERRDPVFPALQV